jgi:hypothetical protein
LDRSKDVKNRSVSLAKSSVSLGEAERFAPKKASANRKGVPSSEHMVPRTATPSQHKSLNSDGRKMHSIVAQKAPTNLRCSNGVPKIDKKETMLAKGAIFPAKSKFPEKTLLEKSRNVDRVTMDNQSLHKRPASSPTKLNMVKQGPFHLRLLASIYFQNIKVLRRDLLQQILLECMLKLSKVLKGQAIQI